MTHARAGYRFGFRAATADGRMVAGHVLAPSLDAARSELRSRGLLPSSLSQTTDVSRKAMPDAELALGLRFMADLLESGLSAARALDTFARTAPPKWQPHVPGLQESIRRGAGFGAAFRALDGVVPKLAVAIVHAGEVGPGLSRGVASAAAFYESRAATRAALTNALIYPAFLLGAAMLMLGLLGGFVIPRFAGMLADLQQPLPPLAAAILATAQVEARFLWWTLLLVSTLVVLAVFQWRHRREQCHAALLRLPVVGSIRHSWASANACSTLATLLDSGVPLPNAIVQAAEASGDEAVAGRLLKAREDVLSGVPLSASLRQHNALTPLSAQLCGAGEHVGNQSAMLSRAAVMERARAMSAVQRAIKLVEPVFILGLGGVVAVAAAGLLQAIYAMRPTP